MSSFGSHAHTENAKAVNKNQEQVSFVSHLLTLGETCLKDIVEISINFYNHPKVKEQTKNQLQEFILLAQNISLNYCEEQKRNNFLNIINYLYIQVSSTSTSYQLDNSAAGKDFMSCQEFTLEAKDKKKRLIEYVQLLFDLAQTSLEKINRCVDIEIQNSNNNDYVVVLQEFLRASENIVNSFDIKYRTRNFCVKEMINCYLRVAINFLDDNSKALKEFGLCEEFRKCHHFLLDDQESPTTE